MSKKDVVSERAANGGNDTESGDSRETTVDIGITVDVELDDPETVDEDVAFTFDEGELLDDSDADAEVGTDAAVEMDEATDHDGREAARGDRQRELEADEREALDAAGVDPEDVLSKECSYRTLLNADVDESIADTLRRRFSLPWSFEGDDGDLERRSSEIRGLGDAEREWIAVSDDEGWQAFEQAKSRAAETESEEATERPCPRPTPVQAVTGVGPDDADALAEAGVISAERLATINAGKVARLLGLDVLHVRTWRHNARESLK